MRLSGMSGFEGSIVSFVSFHFLAQTFKQTLIISNPDF
jgi:hypothetical protein